MALAYWEQPGLHEDIAVIRALPSSTVRLPCMGWPDYGALFPHLSPRGDELIVTCGQDAAPEVWLFDTTTVLRR